MNGHEFIGHRSGGGLILHHGLGPCRIKCVQIHINFQIYKFVKNDFLELS